MSSLNSSSSPDFNHLKGVTPPPQGFTFPSFPLGNLIRGDGKVSGKNTLSKPEPFQKQTSAPRSTNLVPGGFARKPYATCLESADHTRTASEASNRSVSSWPLCKVTNTVPDCFSINSTVGWYSSSFD